MARIVAGVDGSECSQRALNWAAEAAQLRGAELEVVYTYEPVPNIDVIGSAARVGELANAAALEARALVASMLDGIEAADDLRTQGHAIEGLDPAQTLVARSDGADLLVVGSRGRGSLRSVLLGSVSHRCVHHAACPVVIVR
jgi:nucleotide-binding universal stress UspA family protein